MKSKNFPIDFVVPWVDGSDPEWIEQYTLGIMGFYAIGFAELKNLLRG